MNARSGGTWAARFACRTPCVGQGGGLARGAVALACALALGVAFGGEAAAPAAPTVPEGEPGPAVAISEFTLSYGGVDDPRHALHQGNPALPKVEQVAQVQVALGKAADGYVAPRPGLATESFVLADAPKLALKRFYASAILSVEEQIVGWYNRRHLVGIFVATHPDDLVVEATGTGKERKLTRLEDRRPANRTGLRLVVWTGVVTKLRTIASGERVPAAQRVGNPLHKGLLDRSPVRPAAAGAAERADLLDKQALDRYTHFLGRQPGRRVDVALSSDEKPGSVVLDYLVNENKPWYAYMQFSNTGTKYTRPWRERFGFVHNQLTNHDDIFTLDYTTAGFDAAHAVSLAYEAPVFNFERLRWRTYVAASKYTASDVGVTSIDFEGKSYSLGMELLANVFQHREFFLDAVMGVRLDHFYVKNKTLGITGETGVLSPYVGFRFDRITETVSTGGLLLFEWNQGGPVNTEADELAKLGRLKPDRRWSLVRYNFEHAFFLEPLLNPAAWQDPTAYKHATLAHELAFRLHGTYSCGNRLIPQIEEVAGGLYSVRGYPESVVSGDRVCIFTGEYRLHVPRLFKPVPEPKKLPVFNAPFRFAPPQVYGRPDWDLIFRLFFDCARVENVHRQSFEADHHLRGAGAGVELRIKNNFSLRFDCAVPMDDIRDPVTGKKTVDAGDGRIHTVCTLSF